MYFTIKNHLCNQFCPLENLCLELVFLVQKGKFSPAPENLPFCWLSSIVREKLCLPPSWEFLTCCRRESGQTVLMPNVVTQSSYSSASRSYTALMRHFIRDKLIDFGRCVLRPPAPGRKTQAKLSPQ